MIAALVLLLVAPVDALELHPHPIVSEKRLALTRAYCKAHYGMDSAELKEPRVIVIHATEIGTLAASLAAFEPAALGASRKELAGHGDVNVGVHFLVDRDGTVYSLLPEDVVGRHAIGLNHVSLGIENVGFSEHLTPAQLAADAALVKDLVERHPSLRFLIGHHEYTMKSLPHFKLFKELDSAYQPTIKSDPGPRFMARLRHRLAADGVRLVD